MNETQSTPGDSGGREQEMNILTLRISLISWGDFHWLSTTVRGRFNVIHKVQCPEVLSRMEKRSECI